VDVRRQLFQMITFLYLVSTHREEKVVPYLRIIEQALMLMMVRPMSWENQMVYNHPHDRKILLFHEWQQDETMSELDPFSSHTHK